MARFVSDCTTIIRRIIGRRNANDADSTDAIILDYLNDFINLTMSDDVKVFEQYGTLEFSIDANTTDGVYTFNDVGASNDFTNITTTGLISLSAPADESVSWNTLWIYENPEVFYQRWGVNNVDILTTGYPTEMLYYGDEMVFRTIPNDTYKVYLFGYKIIDEFSSDGDPELPQAYWLRYLAYGAALNYARDFRYEQSTLSQIERGFKRERALVMTRAHNQIKTKQAYPKF